MFIQIHKNLKLIEMFLLGHVQKWVWSIWSLDSKVDCVSRKNWLDWFFACCYNSQQIRRWLKFLGVSMVKNGCCQSGDGTLKLTVSEEWTDGIYKLSFCMVRHDHKNKKLIKDFLGGHGQKWLGPVWSQDSKMNRWNRVFFHADTNSRKLKVDTIIFGLA